MHDSGPAFACLLSFFEGHLQNSLVPGVWPLTMNSGRNHCRFELRFIAALVMIRIGAFWSSSNRLIHCNVELSFSTAYIASP